MTDNKPNDIAKKMAEFVMVSSEVTDRMIDTMQSNMLNFSTYLEEIRAANKQFKDSFNKEMNKDGK